MLFQKIRKLYFFIYYCNFRIMDSIASKSMKNSSVHGWTWPMFVLSLNLITIESLFNLKISVNSNINYFWVVSITLAVFNFFVFTYKDRHNFIIEECSRLPNKLRKFGIVYFALYSIFSIIAMVVVIFSGWRIHF